MCSEVPIKFWPHTCNVHVESAVCSQSLICALLFSVTEETDCDGVYTADGSG